MIYSLHLRYSMNNRKKYFFLNLQNTCPPWWGEYVLCFPGWGKPGSGHSTQQAGYTIYSQVLLYVQEVVTRPKILNRTILSNWIHVA